MVENQLEKVLKAKKLRVTSARKAIFSILSQSQIALSAQEICSQLQDSSLNDLADQASVYRNLAVFSEAGLIHRLESGKYMACLHHEEHDHEHMHIMAVCSTCGKAYEVSHHDDQLCDLASRFKGFIKEFKSFSSLTLQGQCKKCLRQ